MKGKVERRNWSTGKEWSESVVVLKGKGICMLKYGMKCEGMLKLGGG